MYIKSLLVEIHCLLISLFPGSDKGSGDYSRVGWGSGAHQKVRYMCGSLRSKSNMVLLRISNTLLCLKRCNTELLLGVGLIRAVLTCRVFMSLHSEYEPHP